MGNKLVRRRQVVDEKYTRPQGLYQHKDVDHKKLRKLILDSKLAPCYPGNEEYAFDLEECPICFLYYPSLNRSRCCMKGICTECFLQMKPPHTTRPTQCPFCKTSNYAVEYRGVRSKEEKGMEQEEQRVIEAKIRMQQQELKDEEERMQKKREMSSCSRVMTLGEVEYQDTSEISVPVPSFSFPVEGDNIMSSQSSCAGPINIQSSRSRQNREDEFDLDLEDIMVMEAIWLSIQENDAQRIPAHGDTAHSEPFVTEDRYSSLTEVPLSESSSPSSGLACAISALAEHQRIDGNLTITTMGNISGFSMLPESGRLPNREEGELENGPSGNWIDVSAHSGRAVSREDGEWGMDNGSEVAEMGTSYTSSVATLEAGGSALPLHDGVDDHYQSSIMAPILPETFEEQVMLAMAFSIAEAQARTSARVAWWQHD
uniref:Protein SIP5-like n=1 Tax=Nelumbo nucifera TaxID=4432 RepID=A0A822YS54_NELNU|nr:TPA_asm: hypothetical protein HUJ06_012726 [Nelumbo nucifera]